MLAKSPEGRYRSADDLTAALQNCLAKTAQADTMHQIDLPTVQYPVVEPPGRTSPTVPEAQPTRASPPSIAPHRRNRWILPVLGLVLAGVLIALTLAGIFLLQRDADRVDTAAQISPPPMATTAEIAILVATEAPTLTITPQPSPTHTARIPTMTPLPTDTRPPTATPLPLIVSQPAQNEINGLTNLWGLFTYKNLTKPGTASYQAVVKPNENYRWGAVWCAVDAETLVNILAPLTMELWINGEKLAEDQILEYETRTGNHCRRWVTKLADWRPGSRSTLELRYSLSKTIYDGEEYTEAGSYRMIIEVSVGQ
jgi:hypothetical protein